jgi:phosphoglycerate dehydrogenase-like enzyme
MIQRTGVGLDSLNDDALKRKNVPVYVNKGVNSRSVAEHAIMLMLSVLRNLTVSNYSIKNGEWRKHDLGMESRELYKKTVGLIGMGHIGQIVAKMLSVFEVQTYYYDPVQLPSSLEKSLQISFLPFDELIKLSNIISLHCPLNEHTRRIIGEREISLMEKGTVVINTSRGGLIDESALYNGLLSGRIAGAGLDVFASEPPAKDNPLVSLSNVICSPHIGGVTVDAFRSMMVEAFHNISLFENGQFEMIESKMLKF